MNVAQSRARAVTDIFTSPTSTIVDKDVAMALTFANGRPNVLPEIDHNNYRCILPRYCAYARSLLDILRWAAGTRFLHVHVT